MHRVYRASNNGKSWVSVPDHIGEDDCHDILEYRDIEEVAGPWIRLKGGELNHSDNVQENLSDRIKKLEEDLSWLMNISIRLRDMAKHTTECYSKGNSCVCGLLSLNEELRKGISSRGLESCLIGSILSDECHP